MSFMKKNLILCLTAAGQLLLLSGIDSKIPADPDMWSAKFIMIPPGTISMRTRS